MRALLLIASLWAGLSAAHAADEDPVSVFQKVCMGPGPFSESFYDFVKANGWEVAQLGTHLILHAEPPPAMQGDGSPVAVPGLLWRASGSPVAVYVKAEGKYQGQVFESCVVRERRANLDRQLERIRSTLGLVGSGKTAPPPIMRFLGRVGPDENALHWSLSSGSSDYVIFGQSKVVDDHIYLQRLRPLTRGKP